MSLDLGTGTGLVPIGCRCSAIAFTRKRKLWEGENAGFDAGAREPRVVYGLIASHGNAVGELADESTTASPLPDFRC